MVSTLIAAITLAKRAGSRYAGAVARAELYLAQTARPSRSRCLGDGRIRADHAYAARPRTGSSPVAAVRAVCINLRLARRQLRRLPIGFVYGGLSPLTHSLEFVGDGFRPDLAKRSQASNGSFAASPSATAYFSMHQWDDLAASYLRAVLARSATGGACSVFPLEVFEMGWVLVSPGASGAPGTPRIVNV